MKLEYNINRSKHAVIFCKNKEMSKISQSFQLLKQTKIFYYLITKLIKK